MIQNRVLSGFYQPRWEFLARCAAARSALPPPPPPWILATRHGSWSRLPVPFNLATHPLELPAPDATAPARLPPLPRASRRDSRKLGTGRRLAPPSAEHGEPLEARQADVFYHEMGVEDARVLEQRPPGGGGGGYRERRRDGRGGHSRISAEPRDSSHRKAAPGPMTAGEDCR